MKYFLITILLIISLWSCKNINSELKTDKNTAKNIKRISTFPMSIDLKAEVLQDNFKKNSGMLIVDTLLLLSPHKDSVIHEIYGLNTLNKLGAVGIKGEGPGEWNSVFTTGQYEIKNKNILLWYSDDKRGHFSQVNLSEVIKSKSAKPIIEKQIKIDSKIFPFTHLIYLNDSTILGNGGYYDNDRVRIKSYNPLTKKINKSTLFPVIKNAHFLKPGNDYNFYFNFFRKHPSKNIFIQPMSVMNRVDIFDENLQLLRTFVDGESWVDNYYDAKIFEDKKQNTVDIVEGYIISCATDDFIFLLQEKKSIDQATGEVSRSFIKVVSWEGKPICLIKVSEDLYTIDIDEKGGYLYGLDVENEKMLRYNIRDLISKWKQ